MNIRLEKKMCTTQMARFQLTLAIIVHNHYFVNIALKDRALLESNPSVMAMPEQKAPAVVIAAGAFVMSVLAHKR
jgi:hypothetical protein